MTVPAGHEADRYAAIGTGGVTIATDLTHQQALDWHESHPDDTIVNDGPDVTFGGYMTQRSRSAVALKVATALVAVRRDQLNQAYDRFVDTPNGNHQAYLNQCAANYRDADDAMADISHWTD